MSLFDRVGRAKITEAAGPDSADEIRDALTDGLNQTARFIDNLLWLNLKLKRFLTEEKDVLNRVRKALERT